jgi:hypothetical protein
MTFRKEISINEKHCKGEICEYLACAWLQSKNLYVFIGRNRGPFDIVTFNPETNETIYIDVKNFSRRSDGTPISRCRPKNIPDNLNFKILNVDLEKKEIWFNSNKKGLEAKREKLYEI